MKKILVAYVSKQGSTKEVAQAVGRHLEAAGMEVHTKSTDAVASVEPYDCVVIGAPINGMRLVQDVVDFVGIHQSELLSKQVAYFSLSYTINVGRPFWKKKVIKAFDTISKQVPPISTHSFAGRVASQLPAAARLIFGVPQGTPDDQRDWSEIESWTNSLTELIQNSDAE